MSIKYNNDDINYSHTNKVQQEFEDNMVSLEENVIKEKCTKCGKITVDELTVDSCDEIGCEFDSLPEIYYTSGYRELKFD